MLLSYTRNTIINLILIAGALLWPAEISDDQILPVGSFSEYEGPSPTVDGWEMIKLGKLDPTDYQFVDMGGTRVVRAASDNAVSGLRKKVEVDPDEYPFKICYNETFGFYCTATEFLPANSLICEYSGELVNLMN